VKLVQTKPGKELLIKVQAKKPGVVKVAVKSVPALASVSKYDKLVMAHDEPGRR
jgi:hypothetical protein